MATRILITDAAGRPLFGLDGHHGTAHARQWIDDSVAIAAAHGDADCIVVEIDPDQGGEAMRRDVVGAIHRCRLDIRALPDGTREVTDLLRYPEADDASDASRPNGLAARQHLRMPDRIGGRLRIHAAPAGVANPREPVRLRRGRMEPGAAFDSVDANGNPINPLSPQAQRLARRHAKAATR